MAATFLGASFGIVGANYIYQMFCEHPDWAVATERSWFQLVAIIAVGVSLALRSIQS